MYAYLYGKTQKHVVTIHEFIPKANVVKVSDEELEFITGMKDETKAIQSLFKGNVAVVIYTKGPKGTSVY